MDTFVAPVVYQLGETVIIPTGKGTVQFWFMDKEKGLLLAVSQTKKQTKLEHNQFWKLHFLKPNKVKKIEE